MSGRLGPRDYLLTQPITPASSSAGMIIILLHGTGGTAAWANQETGLPMFAQKHGFILVTPEGSPPFLDQPPRFLSNPPRWNDGSTSQGDRFHSDIDDVQFLDSVITDVSERTRASARRVFILGFSNGAGMAFRYAAERAERVAGIVPIAGLCWVDNPTPSRPVPTFYLLGDADPLIPFRGGMVRSPWTGRLQARPPVLTSIQRWAMAMDCDPQPKEEMETEHYRQMVHPGPVEFRTLFVKDLGHHWPAGEGKLNPRIAGTPSDRVNANELAWEFILRTCEESRR
jgi:polyhydroxybutyrate depolymerase